MKLSKSSYIRGKQCLKSLWLEAKRPETLTELNASRAHTLNTGRSVGELARQLFPGGFLLPYEGTNLSEKVALTRAKLAEGIATIYEATFEFCGVIVMVDILHKGQNGWELYEVKSSTSLDNVHLDDISLQYFVVSGSGLRLSRSAIIHLNKNYTLGSTAKLDLDELFAVKVVDQEVKEHQVIVSKMVEAMHESLQQSYEPDVDIGRHCFKPYGCAAFDYCWRQQRNIPAFSIFDVFNVGKKSLALYERGVINIDQIPDDFELSERQRLIINAHKENRVLINYEAIAAFLGALEYPISHLDFETFQPAVPEIPGTSPYQQIVFQYSLHIESIDHELIHKEFLAEESGDPRIGLISRLVADVPKTGTVLAYNKAFEQARLRELARDFPAYASELMGIHDRMIDLAIPFSKKYYYHPDLRGKHSIKVVLPHLEPEMSEAYSSLELVQNGADAMSIFSGLKKMNRENRERYRSALLKYCELDTLAMVKTLTKLRTLMDTSLP
jgi:hypothetical protein